jgi:hypothetical protein
MQVWNSYYSMGEEREIAPPRLLPEKKDLPEIKRPVIRASRICVLLAGLVGL